MRRVSLLLFSVALAGALLPGPAFAADDYFCSDWSPAAAGIETGLPSSLPPPVPSSVAFYFSTPGCSLDVFCPPFALCAQSAKIEIASLDGIVGGHIRVYSDDGGEIARGQCGPARGYCEASIIFNLPDGPANISCLLDELVAINVTVRCRANR